MYNKTMDRKIIKKIQERIIKLLPKDKQDQPGILLTDSCSEMARLAAGWIKTFDKSDSIFILKGINVCYTSKAHDILAVITADKQVYVIDPTIWQFFPREKSILLFLSKNIDIAMNKIKKKYGGQWLINEKFVRVSKKNEGKYLKIIAENINKINYNMAVTKIIKLRKVKGADMPYFLKWWKDKELIELTSGVYEKSNKILENYFSKMLTEKSNHHYIIILNNKKIGNISLTNKGKKVFEIHIVIGEKKYWGRGYGVLAIKDALKIAFEKLKYQKAYLEVRPENKRAIVAYQKCGFIKAGLKKYPKNKNQPVVFRMVLLKKNFLKQSGALS